MQLDTRKEDFKPFDAYEKLPMQCFINISAYLNQNHAEISNGINGID